MIKIENFEVVGWEAAIRGIRNRTDSWGESDSGIGCDGKLCRECGFEPSWCGNTPENMIGPNDYDLMTRLRKSGTDHRKFMRMITVYADITAPLYWWNEYDKYKADAVTNSCSTIDNIMHTEFTLNDFSYGHLFGPDDMCPYDERRDIAEDKALAAIDVDGNICYYTPTGYMKMTCNVLNYYRNKYLEAKKEELMEKYRWQIIQLLPVSYNQKRTVMLNYEVLANIYHNEDAHKLDEWAAFRKWIEELPYSEIITGGKE